MSLMSSITVNEPENKDVEFLSDIASKAAIGLVVGSAIGLALGLWIGTITALINLSKPH